MLLPHFGPRAAGGTTLLWILTAALLLDKGNTTEELVVPLQFAALTLLLAGQRAWSGSRALAIGVLGALALLAKPTLIGLWLAIALVVLIDTVRSRHWRLALKFFLAAGAGVVLIVLPVASWLILAGAGREAASAIFGYNAAYSAATSADRLTSIWHGLIVTAVSGLAVLALAGWATGALRLVRLPHLGGTTARLLWTAVLDVPIEFCLAALSGRSYPHYYLPWLAPLAVLAAFLICVLLGDGPPPLCAPLRERPVAGRYVLACLLTCYALAAGVVLGWLRAPADADSRLRAAAVTYVEQHTAPDETVLLWGAATSINVAADRDAPTRYIYQYPLYMRGYQSNALVEQFLHDLLTDRPALIIDDSRETGNEGVPPLDPARRATWRSGLASASPLPSMDEVYAFIAANYQRVGAVGDDRWPIYAYVGPH